MLLEASAWASSLQTEKPTSIFTTSPTLAPTQKTISTESTKPILCLQSNAHFTSVRNIVNKMSKSVFVKVTGKEFMLVG